MRDGLPRIAVMCECGSPLAKVRPMSDADVAERVAYEWRDVTMLTYELGLERDARWLGDWAHNVGEWLTSLGAPLFSAQRANAAKPDRRIQPGWQVTCAKCGRGYRGHSAQLRADLLAAVDGDRTVTLTRGR